MGEIKSIQDIIKWNNINSKPSGGRFLFRGMSDRDFLLIPKISRQKKFDKKNQIVERDLVKIRIKKLGEYLNIRLPAYGFDFHNIEDKQRAWKELFIAQHYGLPTPLLDFTRNPMISLFFACIANYKKDGALYAVGIKAQEVFNPSDFKTEREDYNIAAYNLMTSGDNPKTPNDLDAFKFIVPPQFDPRIKTQNSVFCCFPHDKLTVKLDLQIKDNLQEKKLSIGDMNYIEKWIVPHGNKETILEELNKIGINHATLFPDMDGLGQFVSWKLSNINA